MAKPADRQLGIHELTAALGVSLATVRTYCAKGVPRDGDGSRGSPYRFDLGEVRKWMASAGITGKRGRPTEADGDELRAARIRKERALAERHEIAVGIARGELIKRTDAEAANATKFALVRSKLLGIPAALATLLVGKQPAEIEQEIEDRIRDVLAELSRS
jgi:phage terminase Nu1 subunit (DNA packaging protein)